MKKLFAWVCLVAIVSCTSEPHKIDMSDPSTLFYCVYELSPKTIAVDIHESDNDTTYSSSFAKWARSEPIDSISKTVDDYDTAGVYALKRNASLESEVKKKLQPFYYIYGTKAYKKCDVLDVIFGLSECKTNIHAFTINRFDTNIYGHPLICSAKLLPLHYGGDYESIEKKINEMIANEPHDYRNSIRTKVFANIDSIYFTYTDDFKWGTKDPDTTCFFPDRGIFVLRKDGSVEKSWNSGLDLFGIPCD